MAAHPHSRLTDETSGASFEHVDVLRLAPQRWRNGAGITREIATAPDGAGGFDWRLSVAEVGRDAPFSAFPGIDRCIVLLHGSGMQLRADDGTIEHRLDTALVPFRFRGDAALQATLIDGACSDFNVMVRRGAFAADVCCHRGSAEVPGAAALLLLCCAGEWAVAAAAPHTLLPMQAWLSRQPTGPIAVRPVAGGESARLLQVRLCHDTGS